MFLKRFIIHNIHVVPIYIISTIITVCMPCRLCLKSIVTCIQDVCSIYGILFKQPIQEAPDDKLYVWCESKPQIKTNVTKKYSDEDTEMGTKIRLLLSIQQRNGIYVPKSKNKMVEIPLNTRWWKYHILLTLKDGVNPK